MLTIAWDVDDVLNNLLTDWLAAWCAVRGDSARVAYADLTENPPDRLLGISREEYLASLDAFRNSDVARHLQPVPEVLDWFERKGDRYRHLALTARPLETVPAAAEWVMRHFGTWIRTFHYVPADRPGRALPRYDVTKAEFLGWLGKADVLVDDTPANLESCPALGIAAVLVPRPWNGGVGDITTALELLDRELEIRESRE